MATTFGRGITVSEEEDVRRKGQESGAQVDEWRAKRIEELRSQVVDNSSDDITDGPEGWESEFRRRRRGAMRQVGAQGLLAAIECPEWALLLIYEPVSYVFACLVNYSGIGLLILFAVYRTSRVVKRP